MKKYKNYIILIAILLVVAFILFKNDKNGTLKINYKGFSVTDTSEISKIEIQTKISSIILDKKRGRWTVNNKYMANTHLINKLLNVISNMEISSPVPAKFRNNLINELNDSSVLVKISFGDKILKKYKVIESAYLNYQSAALAEGESEPYVIHVPGIESGLLKLFTTNSLFWRNRVLYNYSPTEIKSVELDFQVNCGQSFILTQGNNYSYTVLPVDKDKLFKKVDTEKAFQYLLNFKTVSFHWLLPDRIKHVNDSLKLLPPMCKIKITDIDNQLNTINLYHISSVKNNTGYNPDEIYVQFQGDSIPVIVKYTDMDPILKQYGDF